MPDIFRSEKLIRSAACVPNPPVIWVLCYDYRFQNNQESVCVRSYFAQRAEQDKIKETIEHGAEAVISHGQFTLIVVLLLWWWRSAMAAGGFMSIAGLWKPQPPSIPP